MNLLGDRLQDKGSARAKTRGLSEQQAEIEGAGCMSKRTSLHWAPILQVYVRPCRARARSFLVRSVSTTSISDAETGPYVCAIAGACVLTAVLGLVCPTIARGATPSIART